MFDPTQRRVDQDVERSMQFFERAHVGETAPVEPTQPRRILLVGDGSSQDALGIKLAARLQRRFGCELAVLDARERAADDDLAKQMSAALSQDGVKAETLPRSSGDSFQQILDAAEMWKTELIVAPCPYGRDFETVGADSVGTVLDVLLARSQAPILALRQPYDPPQEVFQRVVLTLWGENQAAPLAVSWAAGMVAPGGRLLLELVLEREFYENVKKLMRAMDENAKLDPESLREALAASHAQLHRGLQKAAAAHQFKYDLAVLSEEDAKRTDAKEQAAHALTVLALERTDHASQGHVQDRVRRSASPVLIVSR